MPQPASGRRRRRLITVGLGVGTLALAATAAGCAYLWRPSTVPLRIVRDAAACATRPDLLLVMLPGSWSLPEDFVDEGFLTALRARGIAADVWRVDAHRGYYRDRTILDRLHADVLEPARASGYPRLWFVGISIGAYGALQYARTRLGEVEGIVAIGPYLGERPVLAEIAAQGGLARWQPADALDDESDASLWRWLQRIARDAAAPGEPASERPQPSFPQPRVPVPSLWLGYGANDRFVDGDRLLAAALPAGRVQVAPGGHDWAPWRTTWGMLLDALPWPRDATCGVPGPPAARPGSR